MHLFWQVTTRPSVLTKIVILRCRFSRLPRLILNDAVTFSVSGTDADKVTIDPTTGEVRLNESPDYESGKTSYDFQVNASDGELSDSTSVTVNVADVNERRSSLYQLSTARMVLERFRSLGENHGVCV